MNDTPEKYQQQYDLDSQQPSQQITRADDNKFSVENFQSKDKNPSQDRITEKDSESIELMEAISKLEEQLRLCIKFQRFIEAEEIKNKLKGMKLEVVIKKSKEIEARHGEEMNQVVISQNTEIEKFTEEWDNRIREYKKEAQDAEQEMMNKHNSDLNALEQDLRVSLPLFLRTSPKILNLKKMIDTLAKQKEFVQADKLRIQCARLEEEELIKSEEQKENKIVFILTQLASKQKNELNGLKKRVSTGYASLLKSRDSDYRKLLHKLQNIRQVIESTQQLELAKFEVAYKNYVPGETLKFKSRRRGGSSNIPPLGAPVYSNSLNASFTEGGNKANQLVPSNSNKRSLTPMRKDFHIRGRQSTGTNCNVNKSALIPINHGRFASNQKERKSSVTQGAN